MTDAATCRSELVVGARRGALGPSGALTLEAHLAGCASCRTAHAIGGDFDALDVVDIGDGARIRAMADLARRRGRRGARPARRALAAAVVLLMLGGSASAALWWRHRPSPAVPARSAVSKDIPSTRIEGPPIDLVPAPAIAAPAPAARPSIHIGGDDTPAALFARATEARWRGDDARAITLYRRLQRAFAGAPQASLSAVPLGRLLLERGAARAARAQFEAYLSAAPAGPLAPEAQYGRARSLGLLGDRARERDAWKQLCARFPESAYAPIGRARLAELE